MNHKINFLRAVEMTIEPPFNFLVIADNNYYGKVKTCKSLSTAKKIGEGLYLDGKKGIHILNVHYVEGDWEQRAGWRSDKILSMNNNGTWEKPFHEFSLHTAFLWNYDVEEWCREKYNTLRRLFLVKHELEWDYVQKELRIDPDSIFEKNFLKEFKLASKKVERKFEEFISANEYLTMIVKKKYPKVRTQYAVFDRMITFYEDADGISKEFHSFEEMETYYKQEEKKKNE